jgi:26S proteasome regulatory subunit (ATPase 3-interacting protein)
VSDLRQDIARLGSEQEAIQARLANRHEDDTVSISPAGRAKLETDWKQWQRQVGIRRRICRELWGRCSEVLPENVTAPELWVS